MRWARSSARLRIIATCTRGLGAGVSCRYLLSEMLLYSAGDNQADSMIGAIITLSGIRGDVAQRMLVSTSSQ